ncbi:MAG: hypothetical protein AB8F78_15530 [Saprospiraceae bacterium]
MQNALRLLVTFACLAFLSCTTELLHSELAIVVVPDTALGAQPYYASNATQDRPSLVALSDTLEVGTRVIGNYLTTILAYQGVALWKIDSSTNRDTTPVGFINVPGLLDYDYGRNSQLLILSQFTAHYNLDLGVDPPSISGQISEPRDFKPLRFLTQTLGISGYANDQDYYLNCPDPDSILVGFRLELLNTPSCKYR